MDLSPDKFNSFINRIGQDFMWRRAYACPCVNPASGAASLTCPLCGGKGRQWDVAVKGTAGVGSQMKVQRQFAQFGAWQPGDLALTIGSDSPLYNMGAFDRVIMLNATAPFSLNMVRGDNDKFLYSVATITKVFWIDPTGTTNVAGGIPTVGADGTMTWTSGAPPDGTTYSVTGRNNIEYFMFMDLPSSRGEAHGLNMPRRVQLRLFDLFGR